MLKSIHRHGAGSFTIQIPILEQLNDMSPLWPNSVTMLWRPKLTKWLVYSKLSNRLENLSKCFHLPLSRNVTLRSHITVLLWSWNRLSKIWWTLSGQKKFFLITVNAQEGCVFKTRKPWTAAYFSNLGFVWFYWKHVSLN